MEQNNTLSFIQLTKSILEYYGTTKKVKQNNVHQGLDEFENEIDKADSIIENFDKSNFFEDINDINSMFVEVPEEIDEEIKRTFLSQLKLYQKEKENSESDCPDTKGQLLG